MSVTGFPATGLGVLPMFPSAELSAADFEEIRALAYRVFGLHLHDGKEGLVRSRVSKRLRALRIGTYGEYLELLRRDEGGAELVQLVDVLTTNKTSFFREAHHFAFLRERVLPELAGRARPIRLWSAGCSTGEEPVSLAIELLENLPEAAAHDARILATDISTRVLERARQGTYDEDSVRALPPELLRAHFQPVREPGLQRYRVSERVRGMIRLARLNLMEPWPMRGKFDVIFCRNVMIYFDRPTQERLVQRFCAALSPGGHLFVGHSESITALSHDLTYLAPAVYRKDDGRGAPRA